ncbi:hypothetical protein [Streptomyces natalensis]|nr:hypothetical protein [Streptomyces natalensis]
MLLLTVVLGTVAFAGLVVAVIRAFPSPVPDPPGVLLVPILGVVLAPVILAALATHAYVLEVRGVTRPAVVARVVEHQGKSTSYECIMRYGGGAQGPGSVSCEKDDRAGDEVRVVWDPEGAVKPEFERDVGDASGYADFAMVADVLVMCLADGAAAVGFVRRHTEVRRRAAAAPEAPEPLPVHHRTNTAPPTAPDGEPALEQSRQTSDSGNNGDTAGRRGSSGTSTFCRPQLAPNGSADDPDRSVRRGCVP